MVARALVLVVLACGLAAADPTAEILRQGNEAARAGDWQRVSVLVDPLVRVQLPTSDRAEAYRLAGLAAFYQQRPGDAEASFLAFLRIDLDAQLDPTLYQPDVVAFFNDVRVRHAAELRARRPKPRRYWLLNLLPPGGQIQNGNKVKAYAVGGLLGAFAITNLTTFLVLRSWCVHVVGTGGPSATCDATTDRSGAANSVRVANILSGFGLIFTYAYGVYDGVSGYRRRSREQAMQPFVTTSDHTTTFGIAGRF